jgi:hypothetical protein
MKDNGPSDICSTDICSTDIWYVAERHLDDILFTNRTDISWKDMMDIMADRQTIG